MTTKTITDQAGDTVRISTGTLTAPTGHVTVKVNEHYLGREYSAAAHADPAALRAALDEVAPLGKYTRTTPDPDDMDGGVAAALIEKEAEQPTGEVRELREALAREVARGNALQDALDATPAAMTARELLDAAWEAAHVPECGNVPKGAWFLTKSTTGVNVRVATEAFGAHGVRLLDPPAPARPEGAEKIDEHLRLANAAALGGALTPEQRRALADHLAGFGYRSPIGLAEEDPR